MAVAPIGPVDAAVTNRGLAHAPSAAPAPEDSAEAFWKAASSCAGNSALCQATAAANQRLPGLSGASASVMPLATFGIIAPERTLVSSASDLDCRGNRSAGW
jgi:hypothetical protein